MWHLLVVDAALPIPVVIFQDPVSKLARIHGGRQEGRLCIQVLRVHKRLCVEIRK